MQALSIGETCLQLTIQYDPFVHFDVRLQLEALLVPWLVQSEAGSGIGVGTGSGGHCCKACNSAAHFIFAPSMPEQLWTNGE